MKFKIFFMSLLSLLSSNIFSIAWLGTPPPITRLETKNQVEYSGPMVGGNFMTATRIHLHGDKYNYTAALSLPDLKRVDNLVPTTAKSTFHNMEQEYLKQHPDKK